jgi:cbb3-type cytochrome oxidase subunit 3
MSLKATNHFWVRTFFIFFICLVIICFEAHRKGVNSYNFYTIILSVQIYDYFSINKSLFFFLLNRKTFCSPIYWELYLWINK